MTATVLCIDGHPMVSTVHLYVSPDATALYIAYDREYERHGIGPEALPIITGTAPFHVPAGLIGDVIRLPLPPDATALGTYTVTTVLSGGVAYSQLQRIG